MQNSREQMDEFDAGMLKAWEQLAAIVQRDQEGLD
jgi:hypothetical protein